MPRSSSWLLPPRVYPLVVSLLLTACDASPSTAPGGTASGTAPGAAGGPASAPGSPSPAATPDNPALSKARALALERKIDEALALLKTELERQPDEISLHREYQDLLRKAGRKEALRQEYESRLKAGPETALNQYLFGRSIIAEAPTEAEQAFRKALQVDPNFLWAYLALGTMLGRNNDLSAAVQLYEEILKKFPGSADLHFNLAAARFDIGAMRSALEAAEQTIRLDPGYAPAYEIAGRAWYELRDLDGARTALEKAISLHPGLHMSHLTLAQVLLAKGEKEKARAHARQAARLGAALPDELKKQLEL